jgi:hypothetical protein
MEGAAQERDGRKILAPHSSSQKGEFLLDKIQELAPKDDNQRNLKAQASNLAIQMAQTRWLMFARGSPFYLSVSAFLPHATSPYRLACSSPRWRFPAQTF